MNPSASVTVSELATALIGAFEGCVLHAYRDSGGVWTIGWGHTGADVTPTLTWTQEQADAALERDQAPLFGAVAELPVLAQAALVSFGYNCGQGALDRVLAGHATMDQFCRDHAGHVLPSLARRRKLEETLWALATQKP
jgi:lysozyme